ncbi:hypothetical protein [Parafrankia sp. EUN1f]|uniref:hypothetical protein n=1 Tax=Parafrankia sp. EUN1f TaxID=102897 RepID=UPI0001C46D20|nr:hypothetical protein [Parafrankia sp. EUN1f]EFC80078.1 hypothetical protein FrEUN1fDRAFT_6805 [Parafrankia sp. EUN1f]
MDLHGPHLPRTPEEIRAARIGRYLRDAQRYRAADDEWSAAGCEALARRENARQQQKPIR